MSTHDYDSDEFAVFATSVSDALAKARAHGYTNPGGGWRQDADGENYTITVDEVQTKAQISDALAAVTLPATLSSPAPSKDVVADGNTTVQFDLDGEPNKQVALRWSGVFPCAARTLTLDENGDGSFTMGPFASGTCTDAEGLEVQAQYADKSGAPLTLKLTVS